MKTNTARPPIHTHEGGRAKHISSKMQLRRTVMACMLFEKEFYVDGKDVATRITELVAQVDPYEASATAVEARNRMNLRHAPLLVTAALVKRPDLPEGIVQHTVYNVVQRVDELSELVSLICLVNGTTPENAKKVLSTQAKKGLALAFHKFDEHQFAKWASRPARITVRDVMFMVHPKPAEKGQAELFKQIADNSLAPPDTAHSKLRTGGAKSDEDKQAIYEDQLRRGKMPYMALLSSLRAMLSAGVDEGLIERAITARKGAGKVLPFRYVAAARAVPQLETPLNLALMESIKEQPTLPGKTVVLVDVSHSMNDRLSAKSDLTRMDAAATLAAIVPAEKLRVFSFSSRNAYRDGVGTIRTSGPINVEVPPRRGMAGIDAVVISQEHRGTLLGKSVREANELEWDRLIVITDEQSADPVPDPARSPAYMINVASNHRGVGYGKWIHVDGFSESVIQWIIDLERETVLTD